MEDFTENRLFDAVLVRRHSINCDTVTHASYERFAGLMFAVFPVGTPIFYFVLLFRARDRINPRGADSEFDAIRMRSDDTTIAHITPLYAIYRPSMWAFEIVDMSRRIVMCDEVK